MSQCLIHFHTYRHSGPGKRAFAVDGTSNHSSAQKPDWTIRNKRYGRGLIVGTVNDTQYVRYLHPTSYHIRQPDSYTLCPRPSSVSSPNRPAIPWTVLGCLGLPWDFTFFNSVLFTGISTPLISTYVPLCSEQYHIVKY